MIELIRQRLADETRFLVSVEIAEDIEALAEGVRSPHGTGFVVPFRERAAPNTLSTGGFRQRVAFQFIVAFIVRHAADVKGAERAKAFDGFKRDIEQAIAGWQPQDASEECELVGGESSQLDIGVSIYAQTWETTRFLTGA